MKALEALLVIVVAGGFAWSSVTVLRRALKPKPKWAVESHTRPDGSFVVQVRRPGEAPRLVDELPPAMNSVEFNSRLRIAKEDAQLQADEANRKVSA